MPAVNEYETLYIITPDANDEEQKTAMDRVVSTIEKAGGAIVKNDVWGRRRLAFPIRKKNDGIYVLVRSKGESTMPNELDVVIRRTPEILRHLTTIVTKQQLKEEARVRAAAVKREEESRIAAEEAAKRQAERDATTAAESESEALKDATPEVSTDPETTAIDTQNDNVDSDTES